MSVWVVLCVAWVGCLAIVILTGFRYQETKHKVWRKHSDWQDGLGPYGSYMTFRAKTVDPRVLSY